MTETAIPWTELVQYSKDHKLLAKQLYVVLSEPTNGIKPIMDIIDPHVEYQTRLETDGTMFAAGPLATPDEQSWQGDGMFIYRASSMAEARAFAEGDPMHQTGGANLQGPAVAAQRRHVQRACLLLERRPADRLIRRPGLAPREARLATTGGEDVCRIDSQLLLVGSVPMRTPTEVFRTFGSRLGSDLSAIPDGEPGDRSMWVDFLAVRTYHGHPEIETVATPTPTGEPDDWKSTTLTNLWSFKVKPGVSELHFDRLLYAEDAINSYHAFHDLRAKGEIPGHVRFQVCIPATASATLIYFPDPGDRRLVDAAYEEAIEREIATIVAEIPSEDLLIQIDACPEIIDIETPLPWTSGTGEERFARYVASIVRIMAAVPEEVPVGIHWCYGTLGGWPTVPMPNLDLCVRFTNAVDEAQARTLDYVHIPTPTDIDDAFVQALSDLQIDQEKTRVYMGIIHPEDDETGVQRRAEVVSKRLSQYLVGEGLGGGWRTCRGRHNLGSGGAWWPRLCGRFATSCGRSRSRCCRRIGLIRGAGGRGLMTACVSTRLCSCCSRGSRGAISRASWAVHRRLRIAGSRPGRRRGCGSACTASCCAG